MSEFNANIEKNRFHSCSPLNASDDLKRFLCWTNVLQVKIFSTRLPCKANIVCVWKFKKKKKNGFPPFHRLYVWSFFCHRCRCRFILVIKCLSFASNEFCFHICHHFSHNATEYCLIRCKWIYLLSINGGEQKKTTKTTVFLWVSFFFCCYCKMLFYFSLLQTSKHRTHFQLFWAKFVVADIYVNSAKAKHIVLLQIYCMNVQRTPHLFHLTFRISRHLCYFDFSTESTFSNIIHVHSVKYINPTLWQQMSKLKLCLLLLLLCHTDNNLLTFNIRLLMSAWAVWYMV